MSLPTPEEEFDRIWALSLKRQSDNPLLHFLHLLSWCDWNSFSSYEEHERFNKICLNHIMNYVIENQEDLKKSFIKDSLRI